MSDYNASGNPGHFEGRLEGNHRISVVGIGKGNDSTRPLLDLMVNISGQQHDGLKLLNDICKQLSDRSGLRVELGTLPETLLRQTTVDFD